MTASSEWEAKCRRCGQCCFEKLQYQGKVYYTNIPCENLNPETRLCSVYEQRQQLRPGCAAITEEVLHQGILPADCPYVEEIDDYPSPVLWEKGRKIPR